MYTMTSEDRWSNECSRVVQDAQGRGITFERALEIFKECWVEELLYEAERVEKSK